MTPLALHNEKAIRTPNGVSNGHDSRGSSNRQELPCEPRDTLHGADHHGSVHCGCVSAADQFYQAGYSPGI